MLTTTENRAAFLAVHYWDNFDFDDIALIGNADISEQAFVNFLQVIYAANTPSRQQGVDSLLTRVLRGDSLMFTYFTDLSERYLYAPPKKNDALQRNTL